MNSSSTLIRRWFLALIALCSTAFPAAADQFGDFTYTSSGSAITITGYTGAAGAVIIPAIISSLPVTAIESNAFENNTAITSVVIPNGVTSIGNSAFRSCTVLTSVTIPSSVTSIEDKAFGRCSGLTGITVDAANEDYSSLEGVLFNKPLNTLIQYPGGNAGAYTIPSSVTSIASNAFDGCSELTSVTIPPSVTSIGDFAFRGCRGLTSVTIPSGVTSISNLAFAACAGLMSVTIPSSVTSIGNGAFQRCGGLTSVTIPSGVTSIGSNAFYGCTGLASVTLPASLTSIGNGAFLGCSGLTSVTLPAALTSIGDSVFASCTGLTSVTLPANLTTIGIGGFYSCTGLTSVTFSASLTSIGNGAFQGCTGLTSITLPAGLTSIGTRGFYSCTGLTSVAVPASVASIGSSAFSYCNRLTGITVDAANASYSSQDGVLFNKAMTNLIQYPGGKTGAYTVPASVNSIGNNAFENSTELTSINLAANLTSVGNSAFHRCTGLTIFNLPASVASIGNNAFFSCTGLSAAIFNGNAPAMGSSVFSNTGAGFTIYHLSGMPGFTSPTWQGYPALVMSDPQIITHPAAATTHSGFSATLTVTAFGTEPLTYQWYLGESGDTSTPVGTDSASFTTPALTSTTPYWVRVSNAANPTGVNSDTATITVGQQSLVTTGPATAVTEITATLNGKVNPFGLATTARFEYGLTTAYGSAVSVTLDPADGTTIQNVSAGITGLELGQTYHFRLTATNSGGTWSGEDAIFTATPSTTQNTIWVGLGNQTFPEVIWGALQNWSTGVPPYVANNFATFGNSFGNGYACTLNVGASLSRMVYNDPANANDFILRSHANDYLLTLSFTSGQPSINVAQAGRTLIIQPRVGGGDGIAKNGPGRLVLANGNSTYTGPIQINGGILEIGGGVFTVNNGKAGPDYVEQTFDLGDAGRVGNGSYDGNVIIAAGAGFIYNSSADTVLNGVISGGGSLGKANTGTLTLTNANTYTGVTTVSGGTLRIGSFSSLPAATDLVIDGGSLDLNGQSTTIKSLAVSGVDVIIDFDAASSANTLRITDGASGQWTGNLQIHHFDSSTDQLFFGSSAAGIGGNAGQVVFVDPVGLAPGNYNLIPGADGGALPGSPPAITTHPASQAVAYGATATLTVAATGIPAPTFQWYLGASGDTSNPMDGATSASFTTPNLTEITGYWVRASNASGTADSDTATITLNPPATTFTWADATSGNWSDAAKWTNDQSSGTAPGAAGRTNYTLNFNLAGTYTATNDLNAGFLLNRLQVGSATVTLVGSSLTFAANGTTLPRINKVGPSPASISNPIGLVADLTVSGFPNWFMTISGAISGAGGLIKASPGTLTLSGSNTYTGATTITAGTLTLGANNVLPDTTVVSIGNATLNAETFADTAGTLDVTGSATINLGTGAALAFADSSVIDWTGGTLNLTGTFVSGTSLRFGTNSSGLTSTQLALISEAGSDSFALDSNGYLTYSVADTIPPSIVSLFPADESVALDIETNLVITFDENIAFGATGTVTIRNLTDAVDTVISLPGPDPDGTLSVSGTDLTINPAVDLAAGDEYAIELSGTAVQDLAGNPFAGILATDDPNWSFTTIGTPLAPSFTSAILPAHGQVGISYDHVCAAAGTTPITFTVTAGALPTGLTLDNTGVVSGTPSVAGNFSGTITASNGVPPDASQAFFIVISHGPAVAISVPNGGFEQIYKPGSITITAVLDQSLVGGGWEQGAGWTQGVGPATPTDVDPPRGTISRASYSDGTTGYSVDIPGWIGADREGWIAHGGSYDRDQATGNRQGSVTGKGRTPDGLHFYLANGGQWGNPAGGLIVSDAPLATVESGLTYTLSMLARRFQDPAATPVVLDLLADGVSLTPISFANPVLSHEWQAFSRTYDAASLIGHLGKSLTIQLGVGRGASGTQTLFDAVSLITTAALPDPLVITGPASAISDTTATLTGTVNPNGLATTAQFEYGTTTAYGSTATVTLSPSDGSTVQNVTANLTGLRANTTYHYRLTATNSYGTSVGADMTFVTWAIATTANTFDRSNQGWSVVSFNGLAAENYSIRGTYVPSFVATGGNPGGYISSGDPDSGGFTFAAPPAFLSGLAGSAGATLSYDIRYIGTVTNHTMDVMLTGGGLRLLWASIPPLYPASGWTHVALPLSRSSQWHLDSINGPLASDADFQTVLANPTGLFLRGEYSNRFSETTAIDNVSVGAPAPPVVTTGTASGISAHTATLNGTVNPNGSPTAVQVDYGPTTAYGNTASGTLSPNDGYAPREVTASVSGLDLGATYHYRIRATNGGGTSLGGDMTFTTALSSAKNILAFGFPDLPATKIAGTNIGVTVPHGTGLTALAPVYTVSAGASGSPASGTPMDFTAPQTYTITAEDGSTKNFLVTVKVSPDRPNIFSVNFYAYPGWMTDEEQKANLRVATGVSAGMSDWSTSGWLNFAVPWAPTAPLAPVTLTSNQGSVATFTFKDCRNGGPYIGATPRTTLLGDGNGNMMDGHVNSTLDPGDGSNLFNMEVSDIPFAVYDVIFYMGASQTQYGDGTGKIVFNGGAERAFTLKFGPFDGTFTEMADATTAGNYLVFTGVTGSSFTTRTWGTGPGGFNHIGPTGFQIRGPAALYASWQAANGTSQTMGQDHDSDGVANGIEYFIGGPNGNTTGLTALPGVTHSGGALSITWTRGFGYTGVYGTDLIVETAATAAGVWTPETLGGTVTITGNDVTYTFPSGTLKFVRLKVSEGGDQAYTDPVSPPGPLVTTGPATWNTSA
ncbi:MAG: leucine-rich repeat protein, partial [Akkermansiaceae bacterium]|nr:leucine-rich repeat protein [Akkermansiaceae bacterium]